MEKGPDPWFFVGIFAFIFVIWLVTGGPTHPLSFAGPLLSGPGPLGGGTYLALPTAPPVGNTGVPESHASGVTPSSSSGGFAEVFGVSPYQGQVHVSTYVSGAGSSNASNEYLELYVDSDAPAAIDISGWKIESEVTGNTATIPFGTTVPMSGLLSDFEPIIVHPGDQAIISSGRSPIGGSFRENECIGYFGQFQNFSPSLPDSCPDPTSELQAHYGPDLVRDVNCEQYVSTLNRCQIPLATPVNLTSACMNFLQTALNYNGCVAAHQNDANFSGRTWRIYLGRDIPMWRATREVVLLVDQNSKTVDSFSY